MLAILSGFPDNVLAVSASGEVTAKDYREVLVPAVIAKLTGCNTLNFYYRLGADFSNFSAGAIWEDTKIGIAHWSGWGRIAVITDVRWVGDAVRLFGPLFHHPVRVFGNAEEQAARDWIVGTGKQSLG
jgi:hypothetical protein